MDALYGYAHLAGDGREPNSRVAGCGHGSVTLSAGALSFVMRTRMTPRGLASGFEGVTATLVDAIVHKF
ncbi:Uncharacterised protein [Mycobacteroides abscessus subsp. abscessus]|nr:Uncharacterised protein [Mycobacteroides abscessus subsp. abscessus]